MGKPFEGKSFCGHFLSSVANMQSTHTHSHPLETQSSSCRLLALPCGFFFLGKWGKSAGSSVVERPKMLSVAKSI